MTVSYDDHRPRRPVTVKRDRRFDEAARFAWQLFGACLLGLVFGGWLFYAMNQFSF